VALYGDELVARRHFCSVDVCLELIERSATDPARAAVLEKEYLSFAGFGDGGLELVEV
jgi:hypothetical protein